MKLEFIKKFSESNRITSSKDYYISLSYIGNSLYSKKDFSYIGCTNDFSDCDTGDVTEDDKYFLGKNPHQGFYVYDVKTEKKVGFYDISPLCSLNVLGACFSLDSKFFYALIAIPKDQTVPPMMMNEYITNCTVQLKVLEMPSLKEVKTIPITKKFVNISPCKFLNGYVLVGFDNTLSFFDGKTFKDYPGTKLQHYLLSVDEKRKRFYTLSDYGVRIYDQTFNEINRYDLISDAEEVVNNSLYGYLAMDPIDPMMNNTEATKKVPKETLVSFDLLKDDYLVSLSVESLQSFSRIAVFNLDDGKKVAETIINGGINSIDVVDKDKIAFPMKGNMHLLEAKDD